MLHFCTKQKVELSGSLASQSRVRFYGSRDDGESVSGSTGPPLLFVHIELVCIELVAE